MKRMAGSTGTLLVSAIALFWTSAAQAAGPWSVFGNADEVKVGKDWVIALSSDVNSEDPNDAFGGVEFTPKKGLTFSGIKQLSADYMLAAGTIGGGSPRFQINIADADGNFANTFFASFLSPATYLEFFSAPPFTPVIGPEDSELPVGFSAEIPEPGTTAILAIGLFGLVTARRRARGPGGP